MRVAVGGRLGRALPAVGRAAGPCPLGAAGTGGLAGRPVLQTHGRMDPVLPYEGAEMVRDTLAAAGLRVDFRPFMGGHTIPPEALAALPGFLRTAAGL